MQEECSVVVAVNYRKVLIVLFLIKDSQTLVLLVLKPTIFSFIAT